MDQPMGKTLAIDGVVLRLQLQRYGLFCDCQNFLFLFLLKSCNFVKFATKMLENFHGIVLRTVKYGETGLIVDMFTESHGRMSFMTKLVRSRQSKSRAAFWAPLSMVEFLADYRPMSSRLPQPQDVRLYYNYSDLPYSPVKSTVAMFLAEFLSSALRSEEQNIPLFKYMETSLQWYDSSRSAANFHLIFVLQLARYIGIMPNVEDEGLFFDMQAGSYVPLVPTHRYFLRPDEAKYVRLLMRIRLYTMHLLRLNREQRRRILAVLITYYRLHVPQFPELKSLEVLQDVFD